MVMLTRTDRSTVRRLPERGSYDREQIDAILDEALVCHVGFVSEGKPVVIPTAFGRRGDQVLFHGSAASRMMKTLAGGAEACLTATLLDGLVLARSAFHHSMNYRSVVLFGQCVEIAEPEAKNEALRAISEHLIPGRWAEVRPPSAQELKATRVLALPIGEGSAKIRTGPPRDDEEDMALDVWAGVLPLSLRPGDPVADGTPRAGIPEYLVRYGL
jgi:uncharacterized protein